MTLHVLVDIGVPRLLNVARVALQKLYGLLILGRKCLRLRALGVLSTPRCHLRRVSIMAQLLIGVLLDQS